MTATIKDVARAAGVSVASVSRALNGHESVTDATRQRILAAAGQLRYVPHAAARSLITRRTDTIGVLLPDLHGEFFSELIRGIDAGARASGRHLLISSSHGSEAEAAQALRMLQGRVDGLIVMSPHADSGVLAANLPAALPTVLLNTRVAPGTWPAFSIDNYGGAAAMMKHLFASGRRRIAFISGPDNNFDADERLRGYRDAVAARKGASEIVLRGDFSESSGYRAGIEICEGRERPEAIFAANDMMALGCLFAFAQAGVDVPGDIALSGFDDIPLAHYMHPALTTMQVDIASLGESAARLLIARLANEEPPAMPRVLEPRLIVRASSRRGDAAGRRDDS